MNIRRRTARFGIWSAVLFVLAAPLVANSLQSLPKSASIVIVPSAYDEFLIPTGDVKVTFNDGHSERWTHSGDCHNVKVSASGTVGWIRMDKKHVDTHRKMSTGKDSLIVRLRGGKIKEFPLFDENVGIMDWRFVDDGKVVIVKSMGFHGPASYARYELSTSRLIDSRGPTYSPYDKLPSWAKPLADPKYD
jgi:hypothetical protein